MNEDSHRNIPSELENQNNELNEEQLDMVSGGEMLLNQMPIKYKRCAVNPRHQWHYGCDACPECGSTEFIGTVLPS